MAVYWDEKLIKEQLICVKLNLSIRKVSYALFRGFKAVEQVS